jgi:hypothetical protein
VDPSDSAAAHINVLAQQLPRSCDKSQEKTSEWTLEPETSKIRRPQSDVQRKKWASRRHTSVRYQILYLKNNRVYFLLLSKSVLELRRNVAICLYDSLTFKTELHYALSCLTKVFITARHTPVTLGRVSLPPLMCMRCQNHICIWGLHVWRQCLSHYHLATTRSLAPTTDTPLSDSRNEIRRNTNVIVSVDWDICATRVYGKQEYRRICSDAKLNNIS